MMRDATGFRLLVRTSPDPANVATVRRATVFSPARANDDTGSALDEEMQ